MMIQFCFFFAYFVVSLPAGSLIKRIGYKSGVVVGLIIAGIGCACFYPAAAYESYNYFLSKYGLRSSDLDIWKYPSDKDIFDLDLRGIFLGNYVYWEANEHIDLVRDKYGFEISKTKFDRTYRTMSNLDDMHENGIHDYLKYIK